MSEWTVIVYTIFINKSNYTLSDRGKSLKTFYQLQITHLSKNNNNIVTQVISNFDSISICKTHGHPNLIRRANSCDYFFFPMRRD